MFGLAALTYQRAFPSRRSAEHPRAEPADSSTRRTSHDVASGGVPGSAQAVPARLPPSKAVGSTKTIAFIGWPVKSISRTCSRRSAAAAEY
jgi:hypothetical protein